MWLAARLEVGCRTLRGSQISLPVSRRGLARAAKSRYKTLYPPRPHSRFGKKSIYKTKREAFWVRVWAHMRPSAQQGQDTRDRTKSPKKASSLACCYMLYCE
jgi:hypothetical protein